MGKEEPLKREACIDALGLTPDVAERLQTYVDKLIKWQKAINLVGPNTLKDPWRRHIMDSAQICDEIPPGATVADLGSGAGFPGLVIAMLCDVEMTLVESDQRKGAFLREVARETDTKVNILNERIEQIEPMNVNIVTARALAPLDRLLPLVHRHLISGGKALLLKGSGVDEELTLTQKNWTMDMVKKPSVTNPDASILVIKDLAPLNNG